MPKPSYFIPPTFHNPPDGPLRLGQLIVTPTDPANALDAPEPFLPHNIEVYTNEQTVSSHGYTSSSATEAGLFAQALQAVAVKAGVSASWSAHHHASVLSHIERLQIRFIQPDDEYVRASLLRAKVQEKLRVWGWQRRAFMITGLCIAHPGGDEQGGSGRADSIAVENAAGKWVGGSAEASGPAGAGGVGAGVRAAAGGAEAHWLRIVPRQPFVYGFQMRECRYGRRRITNRPATDGAVMSEPERGDDAGRRRDVSGRDEGLEEFEFVYDEVAEEDVSLDGLGLDGEGLAVLESRDDVTGEPCGVIVSADLSVDEASSA